MPTAVKAGGGPPSDDDLRALTAATGSHHSPTLDGLTWVVIVCNRRDDLVVGCNIYTDLAGVFAALEAITDREYAQVRVPGPIAPADYATAARHVRPAAGGQPHIRDDDTDPGDGHDGATLCGLPLTFTERWVDVPAPDGGDLCTGCAEADETAGQPWQD